MTALMFGHVALGTVAVISGAAALIFAKGSRAHRASGNLFFLSMISMSLAGASIAFVKPQMITFLAGVFTCYLVSTAWVTIRRAAREIGVFEVGALLTGLSIAVASLSFGLEALHSPSGVKDGFSAEPYFFFAGLALLAIGLDASVLVRRGVAGAQRIARHLWRMCLALYIAAGSLFTGPGVQAFPETVRGSPLLAAPENIVAILMLFWLARVLFTKWFAKLQVGLASSVAGPG